MKKFRILALIIAFAVIFSGCGASAEFDSASKNEYFDGGYWIEQDSMAVSPEYPMEMPEVEMEEAVTEDSLLDSNSSSANLPENQYSGNS